MCRHTDWMTIEECGWCNGTVDKKLEEQKKYSQEQTERKVYTKKWKTLQDESKLFASRNHESYTDEELKDILVKTVGSLQTALDILFELARKYKRRLAAIQWIHRHAWANTKEWITDSTLKDRLEILKLTLGL